MKAQELREKYLKFFESKEHTVVPSSSLVPENDASVLFTTAGMHPLVPYLLGQEHPGGKRVTDVQKCIRTGDIEEVGDDTHLTFFEMLGNWSFGDYFKKEAIEWSFEFLTSKEYLGIPLDRLGVSVFAGDNDAPRDEEAARIWKSLGVKPERIAYLPKEDNWWIAGSTGPCGPDTEMFYWVDDGTPAPEIFEGNSKDQRWVEIWNDVFMQFEKQADGTLTPLPKPNVDTGMGVERTLVALNGQRSVYDTELFKPLFDVLYESLVNSDQILTGDEVKKARVICDHIKASVFIVGDGVEPSNKERGYVLRRLLRRAMVYAKLLNLQGHWLKALIGKVVTMYADVYPNLVIDNERIFKVIEAEQKKFGATLEKGLKYLSKEMESALIKDIDPLGRSKWAGQSGYSVEKIGIILFDLYQTYGYPFGLALELLQKNGIDLDKSILKGYFDAEFKKHQDLSRTASAGEFKGGLANTSDMAVKYHTVTHLMHQALREVLGPGALQKGSNITEERTRFDFTFDRKMTPEEIAKVEALVNKWIEQDLAVKREFVPLEEARQRNAIGLFGEKYADTVSIYTMYEKDTGKTISVEFCGGPHVEHTNLIAGKFKISKEEAVSAGVRRIKGVVQ